MKNYIGLFHKKGNMYEAMKQNKNVYSCAVVSIVFSILLIISELVGMGILYIIYFIGNAVGMGWKSVDTMFDPQIEPAVRLLLTIVSIFLILCYVLRFMKGSWQSIGIIRKHFLSSYIKGLGIGFVMITFALGLAYFGNGIVYEGIQHCNLIYLCIYFIAFVIQGFNEELLMRGFLMNAYSVKNSVAFGVIINSIIFAWMHLGNDGIHVLSLINLCLAGVCFSLLALYYDQIIVCSAAHSIWNFAQGNLYGILVSGISVPVTIFKFSNTGTNELLNGGAFGLEGSIAVTITQLLAIVILCLLHKRKQEKRKMNSILTQE